MQYSRNDSVLFMIGSIAFFPLNTHAHKTFDDDDDIYGKYKTLWVVLKKRESERAAPSCNGSSSKNVGRTLIKPILALKSPVQTNILARIRGLMSPLLNFLGSKND